jgi:hypothetical protein
MEYLKDSISTSISIKLFKNKKDATYAHIFKSNLEKLPLSIFKNVDNFNPERLQYSAVKAFPINDRPRGNDDILSVKYYQKQIQDHKEITPIWVAIKNNKYILLDGVHRVVASYIENKKYIPAYLIRI